MDKTLIVARMRPGSEQDIASVFAASDATELPLRIGVQSRTLFRFHDLYMHLIEAEQPLTDTVDGTREHPLFRQVSKNLSPFVSAYDPDTWRVPSDAMATAFYQWRSPDATSR
jgi:cyclase